MYYTPLAWYDEEGLGLRAHLEF